MRLLSEWKDPWGMRRPPCRPRNERLCVARNDPGGTRAEDRAARFGCRIVRSVVRLHVVIKTEHRCVNAAVCWILTHIETDHGRERKVETVDLAGALRVVGPGESFCHPKNMPQFLEEEYHNLRPVVGSQRIRGRNLTPSDHCRRFQERTRSCSGGGRF